MDGQPCSQLWCSPSSESSGDTNPSSSPSEEIDSISDMDSSLSDASELPPFTAPHCPQMTSGQSVSARHVATHLVSSWYREPRLIELVEQTEAMAIQARKRESLAAKTAPLDLILKQGIRRPTGRACRPPLFPSFLFPYFLFTFLPSLFFPPYLPTFGGRFTLSPAWPPAQEI